MQEKDAFIAPVLASAAAAPFAMAGRGLWRAAQIAPGSTALGVGMTGVMGPSAFGMGGHGDKATKQQETMKRRNLAAQAGGMMMKKQSVNFDINEVRQALAIRRGLEKNASWKILNPLGKDAPAVARAAAGALIAGPMALAAGLGLGAAGAVTAGTAYGIGKGTEMARDVLRGRRYKKMLKADPSLRDSRQVRSYFNVLDKASPYIAGEPQVAAATVRSMLEAPEGYALHPKYMKDILGVEESRQKTRFPMLRAPTFKGELPEVV